MKPKQFYKLTNLNFPHSHHGCGSNLPASANLEPQGLECVPFSEENFTTLLKYFGDLTENYNSLLTYVTDEFDNLKQEKNIKL
tara:strand:+ start:1448 stop:1696 length:249 start_codon:yes stop_codon:yes gene_type:complete